VPREATGAFFERATDLHWRTTARRAEGLMRCSAVRGGHLPDPRPTPSVTQRPTRPLPASTGPRRGQFPTGIPTPPWP
jgi:hypothetical protein